MKQDNHGGFSGLDTKERVTLLFALSVAMFLAGVAAQAMIGGDLKNSREWISAIVPISGSLFALVALFRAGVLWISLANNIASLRRLPLSKG